MKVFIDSKMMRSVKEAINVPKDSSIEEVYDRLVQFGEYAGSGVLLERIFKGIQLARTIDAKEGQQVADSSRRRCNSWSCSRSTT